MGERPQVAADLLLGAVRAGTHRVLVASIHPADVGKIDLERLRAVLGGCAVVPSHAVERGMLFVNTQAARR